MMSRVLIVRLKCVRNIGSFVVSKNKPSLKPNVKHFACVGSSYTYTDFCLSRTAASCSNWLNIRCPPQSTSIGRSVQTSSVVSSKKNKNTSRKPADDSDDSDSDSDDDDDEFNPEKDWQDKTIEVVNNQLSGIVQKGIGMPRSKAEEAIAAGKIRVNGVMPPKKSVEIYVEDVIDHLLGPHPDNEKFMAVNRLEVAHLKPETSKKGRFIYKVRLRKNLMCDEYKA